MGFWSGVTTAVSAFKGFKDVAQAVGGIFNDIKGQPGQGPVPNLIGQKPNLSFGSTRMGLMEGANIRGFAGDLRLDRPSGKSGNEWVNLQRNYLAYLNMAEAFEEPGKVRRAIKLTV